MAVSINSPQSRRAARQRKKLRLEVLEIDRRVQELRIKKIKKIKQYVLMASLAA